MFSHEDDPESVKRAREIERANIQQWIVEARVRRQEEKQILLNASRPPYKASTSISTSSTSRKELS